MERDPSKRRVKPVAENLLQLTFGMSDSDSDSDYEFKPGAGSDDDVGSDEFDGVVDGEMSTSKKKKGTRQHDKLRFIHILRWILFKLRYPVFSYKYKL